MINGSKVEVNKFKNKNIKSISIVWGDDFDSHAFMFEQILTKLEKAGYSPKDEILENWKIFINN